MARMELVRCLQHEAHAHATPRQQRITFKRELGALDSRWVRLGRRWFD